MNNLQRILLVGTSCLILLLKFNDGSNGGYTVHVLISLLLLVIALSGEIKLFIPAIIKTIVLTVAVVSLCLNVVQYNFNAEAKVMHEKYAAIEYDKILNEREIDRLTSELKVEKTKTALSKKMGVSKKDLFVEE